MPEDAVKVAANVYRVVLENEKVRVLESVMKPGETSAMHGHPEMVVVPLKGGRLRIKSAGGESREVEVKSGEPMYFEATEHEVENIGDTEDRVFLIELKS